ncbi:hypothetical protein [Dactylosporangium sp. NPDC051541]|uniref:hypothetical protein n=1 Tax=Dactylosporangium sp. NPDC051541 TaxID=3363977 RepID=UPI0037872953
MRGDREHDYVEYVQARLPSLRRAAFLVLGDSDRADDAVQDALAVLYRRWGQLGAVGTPPITVAACGPQELERPGGVTGADPGDRYVIGVTGQRDAPRAILWRGTTAVLLPDSFVPLAVNVSGLVAGFSGPDRHGQERQQRPIVYDGTRLVALPLPQSAAGGVAYAVNGHGEVLGTVTRADGSWIAVRWRTNGGIAITGTVDGASGLGLTDDGVAVGFAGGQQPAAQRWDADGHAVALPLPDGVESATARAAVGDWATGDATQPQGDSKGDPLTTAAVRWNLRTGSAELIPGISGARVSATGTVAGLTDTGAPAVWRDGRIQTLPLPPGGARASVAGLTDDGHVVVGDVELPTGTAAPSGGDPVAADGTVPVLWANC